jgi:hypothetical protein
MDIQPRPLDTEISAYNRLKSELEQHHMGKFVIIKGDELKGAFDTLDNAATFAASNFGTETYLIRQVGRDSGHLPASVLFRQIDPV